MKILRIAGRNLASLAGEFEVDFESEPLASSGLFAISGPTGAGKSTLLDALCLALYAATPRLNRRSSSQLPDVGSDTISVLDQRTLLRRGTGEGWAEVDFIGTGQERYRARWTVRRTRNQPNGKLQPAKLSLCRLPELTPIGGTNTEVAQEIVARIGLNFEQFTRAVLLAQNEFSAFLKTDDNERGELLETLTGTTIYSELSRRAFERHKAEQARTRELAAQLDSAVPLPEDERSALESQRAQADQAVLELQQRHAQLETILRWHQEREQLQHSEQTAREALAQARQAWELAQERRTRLATLDAAQGARPLVAEVSRLQGELQHTQAARQATEAELATHQAARQQADGAVDSAHALVLQAQQALTSSSAMLDEAKALDAALALLTPRHQEALDQCDAASAQLNASRTTIASRSAALEQTTQRFGAAQEWLAANARWEPAATDWPRWQRLLEQAAQASEQCAASHAALPGASEQVTRAQAKIQQLAAALLEREQQVQLLQAARDGAASALQAFDAAAISAARERLTQRQQQLMQGERLWSDLQGSRAAQAELGADIDQASQQTQQAHQRREQYAQQAIGLTAALSQAERALTQAELACAASVEQLRATLSDEHPCPVCGSVEHPYAHQDLVLRSVLDGLREQVAHCRKQLAENVSAEAAAQAHMDAAQAQLAQLQRKREQLREQLQAREAAWQATGLATQLQHAPDWFSQQQAALKAEFDAQVAQEQAWQQADSQRAQAQRQLDQVQAELAQQRQHAADAREELLQANAALQAAQLRLADSRAVLETLLAELDAPMNEAHGDGWQARWRTDPHGWLAACARDAGSWQAQYQLRQQCEAERATLGVELASLQQRHAELAQVQQQAASTLARVADELGQLRSRRQALFGGRAVSEVEQQFAKAIEQASAQLAGAEQHARQVQLLETTCRSKQVQLADRIVELEQAGNSAATRLADWLHEYQQSEHECEAIADVNELAQLLQAGSGWIAQERSALQELDGMLAQSRAVAEDRQQRLQAHLAATPEQTPSDIDALRTADTALQAELRAAQDGATALRVRLLQDDERRARAASAMVAIDQQREIEKRWASLAELIGSADGKRFRNYAQQFTLDVLLGYANAHLQQLARRYRLERVTSASGPSLALLVRDQDMGGEIRSVNSLSGGESFLVSLALALGLASLSSNRVQVESLFIDEGFGSLDSDTLGVAMDALDALQSQGRMVGVISHVQEMTERIATRVLVRPSGGGSSAVVVE